ncbi:ABC transporter permease [Cereibacter sediminicola]|uniref:ABC transporter permease n=1 Tax=Cereibacter sediminicola TaxID=2584941 RepID=UPI0011A600C3|nr:ABC transporter permease [Cereibacter sediminicola]
MGAQGLAIALVLGCGVMVLVLMTGTQRALTETRDAYYERHRFAEVFATATRAPLGLMERIRAIDGVALAEPRVTLDVTLDLEGLPEPATARVLSLPEAGLPILNLPVLRRGRLPDPLRPEEVLISEPFAEANGLQPGDDFGAILNGQWRRLTVAGHVLSPEFVYTLAPGTLMPDDRRFGLIWMNGDAAAAAADLDGAFNEVTLTLARGASEAAVIAALDRLLAPYGGSGAHGRDRQVSHAFLSSELEQLRAMAVILPPIFLAVSAFLVNMVLARLIALERAQIGLLKAIGYPTSVLAAHYLKLALGIGLAGVLIGWAAGGWLGQALTRLYGDYFRFPFLIFVPGGGAFALSGLLGLGAVALGALRPVLAAARLPPAVAMAPPAPPLFRQGWFDRLGRAAGLRQTTMMILRALLRWPGRAALTLAGLAAAVAVLVASFFTFDATDLMVEELFGRANRQDVTLTLTEARNASVVQDAAHLPGVLRAEGSFGLPVRLHHGPRSRVVALRAAAPKVRLARLVDDRGRVVEVPGEGLVVPRSLADLLRISPGDRVTLELLARPRESWEVPVAAVIGQTMGQDVHMAEAALFARLRQVPQVDRIDLAVDPAAMPDLLAQVKQVPAVAGFVLWTTARQQFEETLSRNVRIMTAIYTLLGVLIAVGVVYNAARIRLSERAQELASLRVLGFSRAEVGYVLVGELMLLAVLAIPPGWLCGYGLAALMAQGFSTDVVSLPLVIERRTYALAALIVLASALGSAFAVRRRLDRMDLVAALKARE